MQDSLVGRIILRLAYGHDVVEGHDSLVALVQSASKNFTLSAAPGWLVDFLPQRESQSNTSPERTLTYI